MGDVSSEQLCVALVTTACGAREIEDAAIAVKSDVGRVHLGDEVAPILSHLHENDVLNFTVAFLGKRLEARLARPSNGLGKLAACDYVDEAFRETIEPSVDQTATLPNITKLAADLRLTPSTVASGVKSAIGDVLAGRISAAQTSAWETLREECWTVGIGLG